MDETTWEQDREWDGYDQAKADQAMKRNELCPLWSDERIERLSQSGTLNTYLGPESMLYKMRDEYEANRKTSERNWEDVYTILVRIVNCYSGEMDETLVEAITNAHYYLQEILDAHKPELDTPLGL